MNLVIETGRLCAEPETKTSQKTGQTVTRFRIAVDGGGKERKTNFFSCVAFGKQGEFIQKYFHKGSRIELSGRLESDEYTNQQGVKTYSTQIVVLTAEFGESKAASDQRCQTAQAPAAPYPAPMQQAPQQAYPQQAPQQAYPPQPQPQPQPQAYPQGQPFMQPQAPMAGPVPMTATVPTNEPGFAPNPATFPAPPMFQ